MIGIIGAMAIEVENIKNALSNKQKKTISGIEFVYGTVYGKDVVVAQCGVGKVFAAICAQTMILEFKVSHLINTGVAGTLTDKLSVYDMAISTGVVQHDMDTTPIGDPPGLISGINKVVLPADEKLIAAAKEAIAALKLNYVTGLIATGDQFIASPQQKQRILSSFDAVVCEMEGGAIGHTAYVNNVPFIVLRAVSDSADGMAHVDYPTFVRLAAENSTKITLKLISGIEKSITGTLY